MEKNYLERCLRISYLSKIRSLYFEKESGYIVYIVDKAVSYLESIVSGLHDSPYGTQ